MYRACGKAVKNLGNLLVKAVSFCTGAVAKFSSKTLSQILYAFLPSFVPAQPTAGAYQINLFYNVYPRFTQALLIKQERII